MFIEVIYFWVGLYCTLTNKLDIISSKNPITLVNEEVCAFCCVNISSNLLILNIKTNFEHVKSSAVCGILRQILIDIRN